MYADIGEKQVGGKCGSRSLLSVGLPDVVGNILYLSRGIRQDGTLFDIGQTTTLKERAEALSAQQANAESCKSRGFLDLFHRSQDFYKPTRNHLKDGSACPTLTRLPSRDYWLHSYEHVIPSYRILFRQTFRRDHLISRQLFEVTHDRNFFKVDIEPVHLTPIQRTNHVRSILHPKMGRQLPARILKLIASSSGQKGFALWLDLMWRLDLRQLTRRLPDAPLFAILAHHCASAALQSHSIWWHWQLPSHTSELDSHLACTRRALPAAFGWQRRPQLARRFPDSPRLPWQFPAYAALIVKWLSGLAAPPTTRDD
ncbi:hypothetical protein EI94DRAFT_1706578 [Lactarius quietus]|nr:hypothetical protein EI94DRAFT_1706578 [Lactarius quietus]